MEYKFTLHMYDLTQAEVEEIRAALEEFTLELAESRGKFTGPVLAEPTEVSDGEEA